MSEEVEPSNIELDEIEADPPKIKFADQLFYFENGMVVISRMILNMDQSDKLLVLYKPAQLVPDDFGNAILTQWMPEASDEYIFIEPHRIMSMCNPKKPILDGYRKSIGVSENSYIPHNTTLH